MSDEKARFIDYCNEHWDCEWHEVAKALDAMESKRCSLQVANATICDYIRDLADDFEDENGLADDWFDETFDGEEEVFWKLKISPDDIR